MKRIYIFTGKGGVGKSSAAAAHAVKSAEEEKKTLLVSTDMAHNLGDIFEQQLGKEVEKILPNLYAYEIDPEYVMENDFSAVMRYLASLFPETEEGSMQNMGMIPGMEELFSLLKIADIYHKEDYERIIVDCAPTGETLSLLKFPELLSWYMEKFFPIGKVAVRMLAPVSKAAFQVEMPNKNAMNEIEKMFLKLVELQELLKDRAITSVRIVTTPEKMVVEETKRNYMYLNLYNFNVDGIYINRILPKDLDNDFFISWIDIQKEYIACIKESFAALPIYEIPWYDEELKGEKAIRRIVADVLAGEDVFAVKNITERECFEQTEEGYQLTVFLPCAEKKDIDLYQAATDLVIRTGNFKRCIPLPNILRSYTVTGAKFEGGILCISFEKGSDENE
ncbi:MAG: ArsA family ATPase [Lachnospiraceae bacterium]|nr:ArsA family ATPase [Lachnospiraceae bacterium]MDE7204902.1 ArsA family ATPase [Lachnospiraceae bacterium]